MLLVKSFVMSTMSLSIMSIVLSKTAFGDMSSLKTASVSRGGSRTKRLKSLAIFELVETEASSLSSSNSWKEGGKALFDLKLEKAESLMMTGVAVLPKPVRPIDRDFSPKTWFPTVLWQKDGMIVSELGSKVRRTEVGEDSSLRKFSSGLLGIRVFGIDSMLFNIAIL